MEENALILDKWTIARRNVAGALFIACMVCFAVVSLGIVELIIKSVTNVESTTLYAIGYFVGVGSDVLMAVAWGLLATLAANKATRTAAWIICGTLVGSAIFDFILGWQGMEGKKLEEMYVWITLSGWYGFISNLVYLYLMSLIFTNNTIDRKQTSWMMLIPFSCLSFFLSITANILAIALPDGLGPELTRSFASPYIARIFEAIFSFLLIVAYWQLTHSKAFTGKYDGNKECSYSSKNRYFWAPLATMLFAGVVFYLIAANANSILNFITT